MISTLVAGMILQGSKPAENVSFTMILVGGNEQPITDMKAIEESSNDPMRLAIQKLVANANQSKKSWMLIEGGGIGDHLPLTENPRVSVITREYQPSALISEKTTINGKSVTMSGQRSDSMSSGTLSLGISRQDRLGGGSFCNTMMGAKDTYLLLTDLSSLLYVNKYRGKEEIGYYKNSLAISRESVSETEDWLSANVKDIKPTIVLCASGRPQDGHRDLLAFPPTGVILTYEVTFDKRWSAELKDIRRVR